MLFSDVGITSVDQAAIMDEMAGNLAPDGLARALNELDPRTDSQWVGGAFNIPNTQTDQIKAVSGISQSGPWIAMLYEPGASIGHYVVIDGIDSSGRVMIRDSWDATRYTMDMDDFLDYWTGMGVFRRS